MNDYIQVLYDELSDAHRRAKTIHEPEGQYEIKRQIQEIEQDIQRLRGRDVQSAGSIIFQERGKV